MHEGYKQSDTVEAMLKDQLHFTQWLQLSSINNLLFIKLYIYIHQYNCTFDLILSISFSSSLSFKSNKKLKVKCYCIMDIMASIMIREDEPNAAPSGQNGTILYVWDYPCLLTKPVFNQGGWVLTSFVFACFWSSVNKTLNEKKKNLADIQPLSALKRKLKCVWKFRKLEKSGLTL